MNEKKCPLKKGEPHTTWCNKDYCAWWDEEGQRCAMLTLAIEARKAGQKK